MTVLTFPSSPTEGQTYSAPNGLQYVYDGVKWVVETTTSTSEAISNSTQDRVAPMFVDGDNTGITFTYDAGTNTMSAAVTAVNGDTLVNGIHEFTLGSDGTLTLDGDPFTSSGTSLINGSNQIVLEADGSISFPTKTFKNWNDGNETGPTLQLGNNPASQVLITGPAPSSSNASAQRLVIQGQQGYGGENNSKGEGGDVYIWAGSGGDGGAIDPRGNGGDVKLRGGLGGNEGGYVRIESGDAQAENGIGGFVDINAGNASNTNGTGGSVNINAGSGTVTGGDINITSGPSSLTPGNVYVNTGNGGWQFKNDGSFSINFNEVHIATNNWGISVGGGTGATGVVYTAKQQNLASIRVHATIEGIEDGDATGLHTQACDIMIVRRVAIGGAVTVDAVVYGVIYTGAAPLATLDAQWNPLAGEGGAIEITATPTSATENVYVKVYATEVARGD